MKRACIAVWLVACGESAGVDGGTTTTTTTTTTTITTTITTTGTESGGAIDESSGGSSTGDVCDDPVEISAPSSWPSYGRDASNSRANVDETAITPGRAACLVPRWSIDGLAGVTSTPAVVDGVVVFGDWDGAVHAVEAGTGASIWTTALSVQVNDSPLVTADDVFVGDMGGSLHALARTDGALRWSVELDPHESAGIFGSPVLAGDVLVVGVASIELASVLDDYTFRGSVVGLDPADGSELWRVYTTTDDAMAGAGVSVWSTPAFDAERGLVYIGTGNTYELPAAPLSDSLLAIDPVTGDIAWARQFTEGDVYTIFMDPPLGPDADIGAAPNLFAIGDRDVVGVGDKAGVYAVLDRDDGASVWATQLTEGSHLGGIMTTAAVHDGVVYVASNLWPNGGFSFDDPGNTSIAFALSAQDGTILWQRPLPAPALGALTWANGVLALGTADGTVHVLDAATGVELWSAAPGGDIGGGVSVVDGTLFVGHGFWFFTAPPEASGGLAAFALPGAP